MFGDLERGASALLSSVGHQTAKTVEHKSVLLSLNPLFLMCMIEIHIPIPISYTEREGL